MGKILVLVDDVFPYEYSEPWILEELGFHNRFDRVFIVPMRITPQSQLTRKVPDNVQIISEYEPSRIRMIINFILFGIPSMDFWHEIRLLREGNRITIKRLFSIVSFMSHSEYMSRKISKYLKQCDINEADEIIFYSYWMHISAYTALLLHRLFPNSKFVTRCHRYDLYEERSSLMYIPMRNTIFTNADLIFCISEEGKNYLFNNYTYDFKNKVVISHLGSRDFGIQYYSPQHEMNIISISGISAVKRVDLIADGILLYAQKYSNCKIRWNHFGDGELRSEVSSIIERFPTNATGILNGNISHDDLMKKLVEMESKVFIN